MNNTLLFIIIFLIIIGISVLAVVIWKKPEGRYAFTSSNPPAVLWILDTRTGEVKLKKY